MFFLDRQNTQHHSFTTTLPTATDWPATATNDGAINIPAILGPRNWARLPQAVRNLFATPVIAGQYVTYKGTMHKVTASRFGKVMAIIARFAGAPVAHCTGTDIPCDVNLYHDNKRGGTVWERVYKFGEKTICAKTTKKASGDGTSLECFGSKFGFGSGMVLDIFEQDCAVHFVSRSFFIELFGLRFNLPDILTPGELIVTHRDLTGGKFQFLMIVTHPKFGEILFQDGVFHDPI